MTGKAQLRRLQRNCALVDNVETWGIDSIPFDWIKKLAPRVLIVADRANPITVVKQAIANGKEKGCDMGVWFGVPDAGETAIAYAARIIKAVHDISSTDGTVEVMLDLEANWDRQKIIDAVTYVLRGNLDPAKGPTFAGLTRLVTVTCEPQQDWTVFPWEELAALGVAAVYIQCYGAKRTDRRDPLFCTAVALGSGAPHRMVRCMVLSAAAGQAVMGMSKGKPTAVGTYPQRLALTGQKGWAFYLANDWGQPNADPTVFNAELAAYGPLIGGPIPGVKYDRRGEVSAFA